MTATDSADRHVLVRRFAEFFIAFYTKITLIAISPDNPLIIPSGGYRKLSRRKQPHPKENNRKPHKTTLFERKQPEPTENNRKPQALKVGKMRARYPSLRLANSPIQPTNHGAIFIFRRMLRISAFYRYLHRFFRERKFKR